MRVGPVASPGAGPEGPSVFQKIRSGPPVGDTPAHLASATVRDPPAGALDKSCSKWELRPPPYGWDSSVLKRILNRFLFASLLLSHWGGWPGFSKTGAPSLSHTGISDGVDGLGTGASGVIPDGDSLQQVLPSEATIYPDSGW